MLELALARAPSPLGELLLVSDAEGVLRALDFADCEARLRLLLRRQWGAVALREGAPPAEVRDALRGYFAGAFAALDRVRWAVGGTAFQRAAWSALPGVPAGATLSYGGFAARLGCPRAVRAVGAANGQNPLAILLPCHRLVGADGALTGYGGGLARKQWLLRHEGARP